MNSTSAGSGGPPRGPQFDNRRIAAGLIDVVTVVAIALVVGFVAGFIAGPDKEVGSAMPVLVLAWALFYYFALESGNGQTLGKRIMNLRVLTVDGRQANMGEIGVRTVLRIIDGIGLYLVGLITMMVTGQRRQRLGDLAAKTIVTSADWTPAAAARTAAAAPAGAAIVLPDAAPAAGPEMPAAAVPSPFTPLAVEPEPLSVTPDESLPVVESSSVAVDPSSDTSDDSAVTSEPPFVASDPPSVMSEPVVASESSFAMAEPPSVTIDEPVVAESSLSPADPSSVTPDEPTVVVEPPAVTPEPPAPVAEVAAPPPVWTPEPSAPADSVDEAPIKDPIVDGPADGTWEPLPAPVAERTEPASTNGFAASEPTVADESEPDEDEPVRVRSVETMSAMDMLMSELEEDEPAGHRPAS